MKRRNAKSRRLFYFLSGVSVASVFYVLFAETVKMLLEPQKLFATSVPSELVKENESPKITEKKTSLFTGEQRSEIESLVRSFIQSNPDLIATAVQSAVQGEQEKARLKMEQTVAEYSKTLLNGGVVVGNKGSSNKFVVFLDPLCPHCQEFEKVLLEVESQKIDVAVHLYPVALFGENSFTLSKLFLAIAKKATPATMLNFAIEVAGFKKGAPITAKQIEAAIKKAGLDPKNILSAQNSEEIKTTVDRNTKLADIIGIPGVPAVFGFHKDGNASLFPPAPLEGLHRMISLLKLGKEEALEIAQKEAKQQEEAQNSGAPLPR